MPTSYQKVGEVRNISELKGLISETMKKEGAGETAYDFEKASEIKMAQLQHKANEVIHTGNTGFGAELIPGAVQTTDFLDLAPKFSPMLSALRGYHGRNMDKTMEVPIVGEFDLHQKGTEFTGGSIVSQIAAARAKLPTDKVTITQEQLILDADLSQHERQFTNVVDALALIQQKLAASFARTMDSVIINGDKTLTANTNINLIDGTPTGVESYLIGDGLRKAALAGGALSSIDAGTLDFQDFLDLVKLMGENASAPEDVFWLFNRPTHVKALNIQEFKDASLNGRGSTVVNGAITNFLGSDAFISRYLGRANGTGKVSATAGNNTKGQLMYVHRDAVQYGYSGEYQLELFRAPGIGWKVYGWAFAGFATNSGKAGTEPHITEAYNITV